MTDRKRRQRDRRRAGGACQTLGVGGQGELLPSTLTANWQLNVAESTALIREAIRDGWETEHCGAILQALAGDLKQLDTADALRVARLLLHIERENRRERR